MMQSRNVMPRTNRLVSREEGGELLRRNLYSQFLEINQSKSEELPVVPEESKPRFIKSSSDEALGMDSLTIIWYLTTFTALLGFFVVMACTENSCGRRRNLKPPETRTCPPTPCPSYKHFAPPSYDTVMKKYKNQRVFIVPVHENNNFFNQNTTDNGAQNPATATHIEIEKSDEIAV